MRQSYVSICSLVLISSSLVAGCGAGQGKYQPQPQKPLPPTAVKPGDEASLFPLKTGNQWTYTVESQTRIGNQTGTGRTEMVFKVLEVTPGANGTIAKIEVKTTTPNSKADTQFWEVNKTGIYQRSVGNPPIPFTPIQPVVMFPVDAGKKFSWKGTGLTAGGKVGTSTVDSKIMPQQEVDGEGARYTAIGVESHGTFSVGNSKGLMASLSYWSPGVGLVRYRHEVGYENRIEVLTLKLKAKTVR